MNAAAIRAELDQAAKLDAEAREHRQRAGFMLREVVSNADGLLNKNAVFREAGIDSRLAELLMQMAPLSRPVAS